MKRYLFLLLAAVVSISASVPAFARRAECRIGTVYDHSEKLLTFTIDDRAPPYVTKVEGLDSVGPGSKWVKIPDGSQAKQEGWYLSHAEVSTRYNDELSTFVITFGEFYFSRGVVDRDQYILAVNWVDGVFTWIDTLEAASRYVQSKPEKWAYPADCRRID